MAEAKKIPVTLLLGGIAALGMIALTIIDWRAGVEAFLGNYWMYLFPFVVAILATIVEKRRKGGVLSFRDALKPAFGVIVLSLAIQTLFTWILVKWIDPAFGRKLPDAVLVKIAATYRRFGAPEDEVKRAVDAAKGTDPFSFISMFKGLALNYIVGFIVAVLIAAIIGQRILRPPAKA